LRPPGAGKCDIERACFEDRRVHRAAAWGSGNSKEMQAVKKTLALLHLCFMQAKVVIGETPSHIVILGNPPHGRHPAVASPGRREGIV